MNYVFLRVGKNMQPYEVKVPKTPDEWVEPPTNTGKGESNFEKVYNPRIWSSFCYRPAFDSGSQGGQYNFNYLPAVCHPIPSNEDEDAILTHGGWNVSTKGGRRGKTRMVLVRIFQKIILLWVFIYKRIYLLEVGKDT